MRFIRDIIKEKKAQAVAPAPAAQMSRADPVDETLQPDQNWSTPTTHKGKELTRLVELAPAYLEDDEDFDTDGAFLLDKPLTADDAADEDEDGEEDPFALGELVAMVEAPAEDDAQADDGFDASFKDSAEEDAPEVSDDSNLFAEEAFAFRNGAAPAETAIEDEADDFADEDYEEIQAAEDEFAAADEDFDVADDAEEVEDVEEEMAHLDGPFTMEAEAEDEEPVAAEEMTNRWTGAMPRFDAEADEQDEDDPAPVEAAIAALAQSARPAAPAPVAKAAPEDETFDVPAPAAGRASRRAGRVKTRLLGFNTAREGSSDPMSRAASPTPEVTHSEFPVGWLVVTKGPGRGAAFTLFDGVAQIGRGEDQTVRLDFGDTSISRENHAAVAYDPEQKRFYVGHGGKANLVRRNNRPVLSTEELNNGDLVRIGETTLRFVALCGEEFDWTES